MYIFTYFYTFQLMYSLATSTSFYFLLNDWGSVILVLNSWKKGHLVPLGYYLFYIITLKVSNLTLANVHTFKNSATLIASCCWSTVLWLPFQMNIEDPDCTIKHSLVFSEVATWMKDKHTNLRHLKVLDK